MDITTTQTVTVAPEHESLIQRIEDVWAEFKKIMARVSPYVPAAVAVADMAEIAAGAGALIPATNEAGVGLQAFGAAANADNITAALTSVHAVIQAATAIASPKTAPSAAVAAQVVVSEPAVAVAPSVEVTHAP